MHCKKLFAALLALCLMMRLLPAGAAAAEGAGFADVDAAAPYAAAVDWAAAQRVTLGVDAAHFAPDAPCTRAQAVTFLWRAAGQPAAPDAPDDADADAEAYYAPALRWAAALQLLPGADDARFAPEEGLTTGLLRAMLAALCGEPDAADADGAVCTRAAAVELLYDARGALAALPAPIETTVAEIMKYGNLELDISVAELLGRGYAYGDVLRVTVAGQTLEMPLGSEYSDVDSGAMLCRAYHDETKDHVCLAINMGDFATALDLAEKTLTEEFPGFRWDWKVPAPLTVTIAMAQRGGYAGQYLVRHLTHSNDRADYPALTDAEFANFRAVAVTGIAPGMLCRSSSPVDPALGRSAFADRALDAAGVRTILNLADNDSSLHLFEGYDASAYSRRDVIARTFGMDPAEDSFKAALAEELEFMAAHPGPYLIHCKEGKDRTGFVCALLECLMGASADEVIDDYMLTYRNFYGVQPGSTAYDAIVRGGITAMLSEHPETDDLHAADLVGWAEDYLRSAGLPDETVAALKLRLSGA